MKSAAAFPSVTLAQKAKNLLDDKGIPSAVIRTPRSLAQGCGYSVSAEISPQELAEILNMNGLHFKSITDNIT